MMLENKVLVLNQDYNVLGFVDEVKALRYLLKDKVEILSSWEDTRAYNFLNKKIKQPSVVRFKYYIKHCGVLDKIPFSKRFLAKRDSFSCQYCSKKLGPNSMTIDHIHPQSLGGKSSYTNCVIACEPCNSKKGNKTLSQCGMKLIKQPSIPRYIPLTMLIERPGKWNVSWDDFFTDSHE